MIIMPAIKSDNENANQQECFVIMPIGDPEGYLEGHFRRIYEDIFKPAVEKSGFVPYRADDNKSSCVIQVDIIKKLIECPMALCDLSSRNPNVLFELGIRQAFDKPVALVQEVGTPRIFDISSIKTVEYRKERLYDEVLKDQEQIAEIIENTYKSASNGSIMINSIVRLIPYEAARVPKVDVRQDPTLQYVVSEIRSLRNDIGKINNNPINMSYNKDVFRNEKLETINLTKISEMYINKMLKNDISNYDINQIRELLNSSKITRNDDEEIESRTNYSLRKLDKVFCDYLNNNEYIKEINQV
jgi:hypothetical protein